MYNRHNSNIMCIGYPRCGTTYLYKILDAHPGIKFSPMKEPSYYWGGGAHIRNYKDSATRIWLRSILGYRWWSYSRNLKHRVRWHTFSKPLEAKLRNMGWDLYYFLGIRNPLWYKGLFGNSDKLSGDFTPDLVRLKEKTIEKIARHLPEAKVLLILREPIERNWSYLKLIELKTRKKLYVDPMLLFSQLDAWPIEEQDYLTVYKRWKKYFPNLKVLYYDHLQEDVLGYVREVCQYLGLESEYYGSADYIYGPVNITQEIEMPLPIYSELVKRYQPMVEKWADFSDSVYPKMWLERYSHFTTKNIKEDHQKEFKY